MLKIFTGVAILTLFGCHPDLEIKDPVISDKVKACSTGFSESVQTSLNAKLNKLDISGTANTEFKDDTRAIIFSELPEADRLKAYEDYIACVEGTWNKPSK